MLRQALAVDAEDLAMFKAIGLSRQTVDFYLSDLRATTKMGRDIKIFRMNRLGIRQDRIAKRFGIDQKTIHNHLGEMATIPNFLNGDLTMGFTVGSVAQKHGWTDPMIWFAGAHTDIGGSYKSDNEEFVLDADVIEDIFNNPDPKKIKTIEKILIKRFKKYAGDPVFKKLSGD